MKTKNGIYNNLDESEYKIEINNFIFYFSSRMYLDKFKNRIDSYIENETLKINNRYNVKTDFQLMLLISLYKKIEKRGFRVIDKFNHCLISESEVLKDMIL